MEYNSPDVVLVFGWGFFFSKIQINGLLHTAPTKVPAAKPD